MELPLPPAVAPALVKPRLGEEYERWLIDIHGLDVLEPHKNHYETVAARIAESFTDCPFWIDLLKELKEVDAQYQIDHGYVLVVSTQTIVVKPWASFLEKSYRHNVLNNPNFPAAPAKGGWMVPPTWHSQVKDVVRTTILVRFLDGVPLIVKALEKVTLENGLWSESDLEARMDGYYAAHFLCTKECEVPTLNWAKEMREFFLEVQVTTQIKELIKKLLHSYYEVGRLVSPQPASQMSWNYRDDKFKTAYLSHILHYVEGMIIDVRDRKRGKDA